MPIMFPAPCSLWAKSKMLVWLFVFALDASNVDEEENRKECSQDAGNARADNGYRNARTARIQKTMTKAKMRKIPIKAREESLISSDNSRSAVSSTVRCSFLCPISETKLQQETTIPERVITQSSMQKKRGRASALGRNSRTAPTPPRIRPDTSSVSFQRNASFVRGCRFTRFPKQPAKSRRIIGWSRRLPSKRPFCSVWPPPYFPVLWRGVVSRTSNYRWRCRNIPETRRLPRNRQPRAQGKSGLRTKINPPN